MKNMFFYLVFFHDFLKFKDLIKLKYICKKFNQKINENDKWWYKKIGPLPINFNLQRKYHYCQYYYCQNYLFNEINIIVNMIYLKIKNNQYLNGITKKNPRYYGNRFNMIKYDIEKLEITIDDIWLVFLNFQKINKLIINIWFWDFYKLLPKEYILKKFDIKKKIINNLYLNKYTNEFFKIMINCNMNHLHINIFYNDFDDVNLDYLKILKLFLICNLTYSKIEKKFIV